MPFWIFDWEILSDRFPNTHTNPHNHRLEQFLAAITPANPQYSPFKPQRFCLKLKNSRLEPQTSNRRG
ncbi:hypothetical protein [Fischerella thermalis]|jgi:hypothetical protein|uniref:Uncharacterized protein n=1 Tax=Fischerella thermalis JSC-11 TaxID=741277 RepID=G6FYA1_9CYAN|nr:hypothetical protein [Fischerella thermalis]PLZ81701.1 hypothetical protein CBP16_09265 [Fischerella thermalis WC217]PMB43668.1 hypothetical protein CEN40_15455 [Fischerella thermalis CCMEE 5205]EHC09678.1 hypothetical protein FJSC11DRAFT_3850 [Fischerella thermalis JSC-11]MBF1988385.1 hypothetical protein [Fischerella thermalis M58_A2018_009]MBF2061055.1 hypothetical protein [Fischerella thermalis M66_A2018_004]